MRSRIPLLLSLLGSLSLLAGRARAQTAEDFFHGGAQFYISNSIPAAQALVESGLKLYPDDAKLKKLDELLKQQQQQDQQQQDQNQQPQDQDQKQDKDQKKQDQKNQQQGKNDQQKKDSPDKDQQQKDQDKKNQPDQQARDQKEKEGQQGKPGDDKKDGEQREASAMEAQPMTPEEAKKLLDAEKGNEKVLVLQPPGNEKAENPDRPRKDW